MPILQSLLKELAADGATAAGAVAAAPGSLFKGGAVRHKKKKKIKEMYRLDPSEVTIPAHRNKWGWRIIGEMMEVGKGQREETAFDPADVISKLKAAETRVNSEDDTVPFGMEDEDGNLIKVYVRAEQADEFESALASMLAGESFDEDEDGELEGFEIAEVLFQLKDKFDIVDVEWPHIEGDEEEEQEIDNPEADAEFGDGEMDTDASEESPFDAEADGEMEDDFGGEEDALGDEDVDMEPEGGAESALQQVIDMMKADAEARKAESEARAKEAEARAAEANASAASAKVKQEEQVLDMETYNEQKKTEEEEAKRLAKLAKWKHDQAQSAETKMAEEEESIRQERDSNEKQAGEPISVQSLADELIRRLQGSIR